MTLTDDERAMLYEPDTLWGRTDAGDREIAMPHSGLSVVQRRLLKKLAPPCAFAVLAARHRIPPHKLEHELVRLAELELVAFQRPGSLQPRTAPRINLTLPQPERGPHLSAGATLPLAIVAFACGFVLVLIWAA